MLLAAWPVLVIVALVVAGLLYGTVVVYTYEWGLRFRFGTLLGPVDPGLRFQIPLVDSIETYTRRVVTVEVPPQSVMTRDNVSVDVSAVVYFRVTDPEQTVVAVQDHEYAVTQLARSTLRGAVGATDLDDVLADRDALAGSVAETIESIASEWGIDVVGVELTNVEIPAEMQRVIAAQAEAEREKRARTRLAEAEREAADRLAEAGETLAERPEAMRLRLFQNFKEVAAESNSTVVAPIPIELLDALESLGEQFPTADLAGTESESATAQTRNSDDETSGDDETGGDDETSGEESGTGDAESSA